MSTDLTTANVSLLTQFDDLQPLAAAWNALAGDIPFRRFEWAETWWRHYQDARSELFVLVVRDADNRVLGIAPWFLSRAAAQGRTLKFLGSGEICSDYLTLLTTADSQQMVVNAVSQYLAHDAADKWQLLDVKGATADDTALNQLAQQLAEQGYRVHRDAEESCWRLDLPSDWDGYLATISRSKRERARKQIRKLEDSGRAFIHEVKTADELTQAFDILIDLHQKRRQSLGQTGCFVSERFTGFHREISRTLLAEGRLSLSWIEIDGRPASVEYSFLGGDTVYYYQGGFDPQLGELAPGAHCNLAALRRAIQTGYRVYDFLRGDEPYKAAWGAKPRQLIHLRVVGRQPSARMRDATRRGAEVVKGMARRILIRTSH